MSDGPAVTGGDGSRLSQTSCQYPEDHGTQGQGESAHQALPEKCTEGLDLLNKGTLVRLLHLAD